MTTKVPARLDRLPWSVPPFFAIGTAVEGITGPLLFGHLIHSGDADLVAVGFLVGAAVMAPGGPAEVFFGVRAEQQSLENIARPLTAEEAEAVWRNEPSPQDARDRLRPEHVRQAAHERDRRNADRTARRRERERAGARRYRPGTRPGSNMYSPATAGTAGTASRTSAMAEQRLDDEIEQITGALRETGPTSRDRLEQAVGGRSWDPGRFRRALSGSVRESRTRSPANGGNAPTDGRGRPDSAPGGPHDQR